MSRANRHRAPRHDSVAASARRRIAELDWEAIGAALSRDGFARVPGLLARRECRELSALYNQDERFRTRVDLGRYRFGVGEYKYFANPLPPLVQSLRTHLYPPLAEIANRWSEELGTGHRYPATLARFLETCHAAGQRRPTPLLLHYEADGFNCLHRDLYGSVVFPLQLTCLLARPAVDFEGGEFLLVEQRPRMQSRAEAFSLEQGEVIVFPTHERPVRGSRGYYRAKTRHGVSRIRSGERLTLGIIFHDAK